MGQILKQQYEQRDLIKALAELNGFIDKKTEKLSDKLKNTELSHNRKYKLLQKIEKNLKIVLNNEPMTSFSKCILTELLSDTAKELMFVKRVKGIF